MNTGTVIARLRRERGWSQEALALKLFVSKDLVSKWENGSRRPDWAMIEQIAAAFGVSVDSILEKDKYVFKELSDCIPDGIQIPESEFTALLNSFLRTVGRNEAEIFLRRYYLLESITVIAERKGIRENHVRSRLSKTRKKLKDLIRREYDGR